MTSLTGFNPNFKIAFLLFFSVLLGFLRPPFSPCFSASTSVPTASNAGGSSSSLCSVGSESFFVSSGFESAAACS